jgi:alkaline phosphatase D
MTEKRIHRRTFHAGSLSAALIANPLARAAHATWVDAPKQLYGIMAGEVTSNSAVIWGRSDCESQMEVEWDTAESFSNPRRVIFPPVNALSDFTSHGVLQGLPSGADVFYRVAFRGRDGVGNTVSDSIAGRLKLASETEGDVFFAWSGDTAGQGFGINLEWGGMRIYSAIERIAPQFFIHSGDMIYADNPIAAEMKLADGTIFEETINTT